MTSAMASEIAEVPEVARRLLADDGALRATARRLGARQPPLVVVCGRGSSGQADLSG